MKIKNYLLLVVLMLSCGYNIYAQVPFTTRLAGGNIKIKGDLTMIGNSILGEAPVNNTILANNSFTGGYDNNGKNMEYIDIDSDNTTFSSSSANLNLTGACAKVAYVGLYWSAAYGFDRSTDSNSNVTGSPRQTTFNQIKLKLPGSATYIDIVADNNADIAGEEDSVIYDALTNPLAPSTEPRQLQPYTCYKNITNLVKGLANANGTYVVADMLASRGKIKSGGCGGWTMVVIYEDVSLPSKYISIFDGFQGVLTAPATFSVNGFKTIPTGPVRANIGIVALDGDRTYPRVGQLPDGITFKANSIATGTVLSNLANPANNFFNSTISINGIDNIDRSPASTNTLGFDQDLFEVNNPGNAVVPNNETGATYSFTADENYYVYLTTFAVEIIEPKIILTKTVQNALGEDIAGENVSLCQNLQYTLGFQNIGNNDAASYTIRDVLPTNINFDPLLSGGPVILPTPPVGIAPITWTYNAITREIIFTVPNGFVPKNGPRSLIILKVNVLCSCSELDDACSNILTNQAFSTYRDIDSTIVITNDPSLSSFTACNVNPPSPTNSLVGYDICLTQNTTATLCGSSVTLTAPSGYTTYTWSGPAGATITPVANTNNASVTVSQLGVYTVINDIPAPCKRISQNITVVNVNGGLTPLAHPVEPYADNIRNCPNGNINVLPEINLCGAGSFRTITTTITGASSVSWERLNTASCPPEPNVNCPNVGAGCTWTVVDSDNDNIYVANAPGQYRVVFVFQAGCAPIIFYFNVYQDPFNPNIEPRDKVCNTSGRITLSGVPAGYQYQLNCTGGYTPITSNPFSINVAPGLYSLCISQIGVPGGCVFTYNNIAVGERLLTTDQFITQPLCATDKGCIRIDAIGVYPQYTFSVTQLTPLAQAGPKGTFGPSLNSSTPIGPTPTNPFCNLSPGTYTYTITTEDGCLATVPFTINQPPAITLTAGVTRVLSCNPGQITIYPVGGRPPYNFVITGPSPFVNIPTQSALTFDATVAGNYNITVYDQDNCSATTSIAIAAVPPPVFTPTSTPVLCYGANTGNLNFNVTNANGFTLAYSYDNGVTFSSNASLPNQVAGTYCLVLRYTLGTSVCTTTPICITITQPFAALTASAGVSELVGCGPLGEGKVRITNPQGGTPGYTYSFNNQVSYSPVNEALLQCGTYTVYIKDANNCIFAMPVTLDCAPTPPTIVVTPPVFACTGTATSTVTVNNNGGNFTYTYSISPPLVPPHNPTSNVFNNVLCGNSVVTVNYNATNIPTPSNLLFEDFGEGPNTTAPGIAAAYCWNNQPFPPGQACSSVVVGYPPANCSGTLPYGSTYVIEDNQYDVTSALNPNICVWYDYKDHTSNGTNPIGRYLAVNIGSAAGSYGVLYSKQINNILPNQPISVELYVANLIRAGLNGFDEPDFLIELVDSANNVIASQFTGLINNDTNNWKFKSISLNPGANTSLTFKIRSGSTKLYGNDAGIDDIRVFQQPIACATIRNFPINIACGQAFTADVTSSTNVTCNGLTNGTITISAQNFDSITGYQYSLDGGTNWLPPAATPLITSPFVIPNVAGSVTPYNVQIRYNALAANATCSYSESITVFEPTAITGSVSILPATCSTGATITVTASGGTGALQYQLLTAANAVVPGFVGYQASNVFSNVPFLPTGNYIVLVRDGNQCVISTPIPANVVAPVSPTAVIAVSSNYCYTSPAGASLVVTASGGLPPYRYSLNGGTTTQTSNTFGSLIPGTYTITVLDAANCPFTLPVQTIQPQLTASAVLTKELTCSAPQAAVITTTINGGYSLPTGYSYQVNINGALGAASPVISNPFTYSPPVATTGTFFLIITDSRLCTTQTNSITINPTINPTATNPQVNVSCNGLSNGSFVINASLGVAPYTYAYNGSATYTNTTSYTSLAAGTYTYIVRDSKGCTFNGSVTITQPDAITGVLTLTTPYKCGQNGVLTVSGVTGGTAPYSYSISGNAGPFQLTPLTFPVTAGGNYVVTIKDNKGCTFNTNTINVDVLDTPRDLTFNIVGAGLSCPANTVTVNVNLPPSSGGTPPIRYQILSPAASATALGASGVFSGLSPGSYIFNVVDKNNCSYQETYVIDPLPVVTVTANPAINVRCFGSATGGISFNVGGFGASYNYTITGPVASSGTAQTNPLLTIPNLPAGTYTIVVRNPVTNCTATINSTIGAPTAALTILPLNPTLITCNALGSLTVSTTGGWGGNVYSMSPLPAGVLQAGNVFTNIPAGGPYIISVTDSNGCVVTSSFSLSAPVFPSATISAASDFCFDAINGAQITATPSGGVPGYTYSYTSNGGASIPNATNVFSNLTPLGSPYVITIKDSFGCPFTLPAQVIAPQLTLDVITKGLDCSIVTPNATFNGTIANGYPTYTVAVNVNGGGFTTNVPLASATTFLYSTPSTGTYQFEVTDDKGCKVQSIIYTVAQLSLPQVTATQSAFIKCKGASTGAISVVVNTAVGTAPFSFVVQQTLPGSINFGTQTTGLPAGTYTVTLTDGKNCIDVETVAIAEPNIIAYTTTITPLICSATGPVLGQICINTPIGGTPPYTYELFNQTTGSAVPSSPVGPTTGTQCFPNLNFGLYTAEVTDANGCTTVTTDLKIASPPNDIVFTVTPIVATCAAGATISVTVGGTVLGVGPFEFGVVNAPAPLYSTSFVPPSNPLFTHIFTGLPTGSIVTVVVRDIPTGCLYFETFPTPLPSNSNLTSAINTVNPVSCNGGGNGSANVTVNNYSLTTTNINYAVYDTFGVLVAGTNGNVLVPVVGTITPIIINNIGPLIPGTYTIRFVELGSIDQGCGATSAQFTITQSATPLVLSASATKNDNCNLNAGQITAVPSGGTSPYTYLFLPAGSPAPLPAAIIAINNVYNTDSGTYDVYVKDANGCVVSNLGVILPLDPTPVVAASLVNACVNQGTYQINVTLPTAGLPAYTFIVDNSVSPNTTAPFTISNLNAGTHTIEVRDFNGCGNSVSVTILQPLVAAATFTTQPTCLNNDGTITATASGGSGNYTYTLLTAALATIQGPQALPTFGSQPAGNYIIRVTDTTTGCSAETPFSLALPTSVTFAAPTTPVTCFGSTDGTITINLPASQNNPVYTFAITNGPIGPGYPIAPVGNVFSGLAAGTYEVVVTSGRGCSLTDSFVIVGSPTAVVASGSATAFTCAANGTINQSVLTVSGANGTPEYTYSINGVNYFATNTFNINNTGAVQNITVYVKDLKGCIDTEVVVVNPLPGITSALITQNSVLTCAAPREELITINPVGGSGNYTYQVLPAGALNVAQVGTTNQFNIYAPGTYYFQVNDLTSGCSFPTLPYTILPFNLINAVATPVADVVCFGDTNGSVSVNVTGYTGAYTYTVLGSSPLIANIPANTSTNPLVITGVAAGSYTIEITETAVPYCIYTTNSVTVGSPIQVGLTLVSNINANCNSGAVVTVSGNNGTPSYQYAFMQNGVIPVFPADYSAANSAVLNPLTNTQWDVYVRDANGCFTFIDVTIAADAQPTVTLPPFAADQCISAGNSYTFTATGSGLPPLTYNIGSGPQPTGVFTVTTPGPYTVTITDKNGCTATASITVYPPIGITPSPTLFPTCALNDGVVTVATVGGSGAYTYSIVPNPVALIPATITIVGNVISGIPFGSYTITVTDNLTGCFKNAPIVLPAPTPVTFTATPRDVTCFGSTDGTITVTLPASQNNPIYTYAITAGPSTVTASTNNVFTGLAAGTYTVVVTSGQGCSFTDNNVVVGDPDPIVVPLPSVVQFGCTSGTNSPNLATITVNGVTGGSNVYPRYQFVLGGTTVQNGASNVLSIAAGIGGTYTINVFDDKGCVGTTTQVINPFISIINPTVVVDKLVDCNTGEDITVSVTTTGGAAPLYSYNATKVPVAVLPTYNVTNNNGDFNGLPVGDYLITVTNTVTGCSVTTFHYVNTPITFNLVASNLVTTTCFGGSDGSVQLTVVDTNLNPTNDAGPFTWTILNSSGGLVQTSGAIPTANAGPITISGLSSGIYTANIDLFYSPFCPVTKNFTIVQPALPLTVTAVKTVITCIPGADGKIIASATGGWGTNYQFQLQIGAAIVGSYSYATNGSNTLFTGLIAGNYTVYVRDEKGCVDTFDVNLVNLPSISATFTVNTPLLNCFSSKNGSISISYPTGGQGSNYTVTYSGTIPSTSTSIITPIPLSGLTISNLQADTYIIEISDGYGCTLNSGPLTIAQPTKVVASVGPNTNQTCLTQATLLLTGIGGTPPYRYQLNGVGALLPAVPFASSTIISVPVGTYNYVITDANGCRSSISGDVTISPITPLTLSTPVVRNILCGGLPDGTISVVATGGLPLYTYVYTITNSAGNPVVATQSSPGVFSNLLAGSYIITVTSFDCIKSTGTITITEPTPFLYSLTPTQVKCNGDSTGSIIVNFTGGTGPFTYYISPNINNPNNIPNTGFVITGLTSGSYNVIIRDANGCFNIPVVNNITIGTPTPLTSAVAAFLDEVCADENLGQITLGSIGGGTPPYTVSYDAIYPDGTTFTLPPVSILSAANYVFNNLNGGDYITIVKDANGCLSEQSQRIGSGVSFEPRAFVSFPCISNSPAVEVEVTNAINFPSLAFNPLADYLFNLDVNSTTGAQASPIFTSAAYPSLLIPGSHTIYVFNANGCSKDTQVFTITGSDIDALTLTLSQPVGSLNTILATSTGGSGGNNYSFNGNNTGSTNTYVYDESANYTVTVTDNSGCSRTVTQPFVFIPIKIPNVFTPNGNGINDGWGPTNTSNYPNLVTRIYDRYGRKIYEMPEGKFWDGKYEGQELPSGDYWYVIRIDDKNDDEYVGHFTLYR